MGAGSKPTSRFTTPIRQIERTQDDDSIISGMDVDEGLQIFERGPKMETVFAKSDGLTATFYASLPVEVKHALKTAGIRRRVLLHAVQF